MFGNIGPGFVTVLGGVFTLALAAVILSKQANTANVLKSGGDALKSIIGAAVQPVSSNSNLLGSVGVNIGGISS
jgi:hypothetical protein